MIAMSPVTKSEGHYAKCLDAKCSDFKAVKMLICK